MDGVLTPEEESKVLAELLRYWALKITLDTSSICAMVPRAGRSALQVY
jgi:hypothetical protein